MNHKKKIKKNPKFAYVRKMELNRTGRKKSLAESQKEKELSYSRVVSNYRLSDWLKRFCVKRCLLSQPNERETFIDEHGVHRFMDTWQPVPVIYFELENQGFENYFLETGCMPLSYIYNYFVNQEENEDFHLPSKPPDNLHQIAYISEWQRLWIYLENDESDDLAEHAPLYRLIIEFLFHPRMQNLMMAFFSYLYFINILLLILFPSAIDPIPIFYLFFELLIQSVAYFSIVVVYRGIVSQPDASIFEDPLYKAMTEQLSEKSAKQVEKEREQKEKQLREGKGQRDSEESRDDEDEDEQRKDHKKESQDDHDNDPAEDSNMSYLDAVRAHLPGVHKKIDIAPITKTTQLKRHFYFIRKELFSRIKYELSLLHPIFAVFFSSQSIQQQIQFLHKQKRFFLLKQKKQKRKLSYHEILNISLKFLTRVNSVNIKTINFDRITYRCLLLFIICVFPIYLLLHTYLTNFVLVFTDQCNSLNPSDDQKEFCTYFFFYFVLTCGTLMKYFVHLIYGMSVLVALVSLAYGTEIAYRLADSFILKFKSLRRVEEYDLEEYFQISVKRDAKKKFKEEQRKRTSSAATHNSNANSPNKAPGRPISLDTKKKNGGSSGSIYEEKEEFQQFNPMLKRGSKQTSTSPTGITIALPEEKELKEEIETPSSTSSTSDGLMKRRLHSESEQEISDHPLYYWVKRDATEHYFFICEVFSASDRIWSPFLSGIFFICFSVTVIFILFAYTYRRFLNVLLVVQLILYCIVRVLILFIYPIMCLCHANRYIYELSNAFKRSSKEDFALIGGCDRWIQFIADCPAAWTFYGLWITWDRLIGLIWTFAAAGMASLVGTLYAVVFNN
jgi:hypothetical protein